MVASVPSPSVFSLIPLLLCEATIKPALPDQNFPSEKEILQERKFHGTLTAVSRDFLPGVLCSLPQKETAGREHTTSSKQSFSGVNPIFFGNLEDHCSPPFTI